MTKELVRGDSMELEMDGLRARPAQHMRKAITQAALPGAAQTPSGLLRAPKSLTLLGLLSIARELISNDHHLPPALSDSESRTSESTAPRASIQLERR